MAEEITDVPPSDTSDNEGRSNYLVMEGLIISSDLEGNGKTCNKNKEKPLSDKLSSFTPIIVSAIDNIRNIKCKRPDIDVVYWYVSKNVANNIDRDFIVDRLFRLYTLNYCS